MTLLKLCLCLFLLLGPIKSRILLSVEGDDGDASSSSPCPPSSSPSAPYELPEAEREGNQSEECPKCIDNRYLTHYSAKNCRPIFKENCPQCPLRYDCSSFVQLNAEPDSSECDYRGEKYAIGEDIRTINPCQRCVCGRVFPEESFRRGYQRFEDHEEDEEKDNKTVPDVGVIRCANVECPEGFGVPPYPLHGLEADYSKYKNCYYAYEPNTCCASRRECPTDEDLNNTLVTCQYKERSYKVGEKIYPKEDKCMTCICTSEWNPEDPVNSPGCERQTCFSSPRAADSLKRGCIPIYHEGTCCEIDHHCLRAKKTQGERATVCAQPADPGICLARFDRFYYDAETDNCLPFIYGGCSGNENNFEALEDCEGYCKPSNDTQTHPDLSCQFNGRSYDIGSKLKINRVCVECSCQVPPDFTCVHKMCEPPQSPNCTSHYKIGDCCPSYDCSEKPVNELVAPEPCFAVAEDLECPSENCTKSLDERGCAQCFCLDSCPTPLCAADCRISETPGQCPGCQCDDQLVTESNKTMETNEQTNENNTISLLT